MDNKYLKKIKSNLTGFFCYFKDKDILVISEDKSVMPFAYLISDEVNYPGKLLISFAIDFPFSEKAAYVALCANRVKPVVISEQFYIAQNGTTYIGKDASKYFEIDVELPLDQLQPESSHLH